MTQANARITTRQHGPALAALRKKDGYTVKQLAELVRVSASHLRNLENEHRVASFEHLNNIARVLGVPLAAVSRDIEVAPANQQQVAS